MGLGIHLLAAEEARQGGSNNPVTVTARTLPVLSSRENWPTERFPFAPDGTLATRHWKPSTDRKHEEDVFSGLGMALPSGRSAGLAETGAKAISKHAEFLPESYQGVYPTRSADRIIGSAQE